MQYLINFLFMNKIIKKHHKNKLFSNVNIVLASLVLAIWLNIFLVDWTSVGQSLKTSVLNSQTTEKLSDLSIEKEEWDLYIVANKNIKSVSTLALSLTYNPENVVIWEVNSNLWDVVNLTNTPWISSIILTSEAISDIKNWDRLIKIIINKSENKSENLNIINANFKDINNEQFLLSTSGITF